MEDFEERFALDDVQVAVGQRADIRRRLTHRHLLPEHVAEHVATTYSRKPTHQLQLSICTATRHIWLLLRCVQTRSKGM